MNDTIEKDTRQRVAKFLPDAISKTLESYRYFMEGEVSVEETKEFSARHTAAKVAIAHLELLLKLAKWADIPSSKSGVDKSFYKIVEEAQREITNYTKNHK